MRSDLILCVDLGCAGLAEYLKNIRKQFASSVMQGRLPILKSQMNESSTTEYPAINRVSSHIVGNRGIRSRVQQHHRAF